VPATTLTARASTTPKAMSKWKASAEMITSDMGCMRFVITQYPTPRIKTLQQNSAHYVGHSEITKKHHKRPGKESVNPGNYLSGIRSMKSCPKPMGNDMLTT